MHKSVKGLEFLQLCNRVGMIKFLGYVPTLHILYKGRVYIYCHSHFDAENLLHIAWLWGSSSLVLKF
jgi:hypothetical protein